MTRRATSRRSSVLVAIAAASVAVFLAGCSSLVTVRNDSDYYNLELAQHTADRACAARGAGPAQYVMTQHNPQAAGSQWAAPRRGPPEILYRCTPAGARTS